jgi:hypothetical protein
VRDYLPAWIAGAAIVASLATRDWESAALWAVITWQAWRIVGLHKRSEALADALYFTPGSRN